MNYYNIILFLMLGFVTVKCSRLDIINAASPVLNFNSIIGCVFNKGPCDVAITRYKQNKKGRVEQAICKYVESFNQLINGLITDPLEDFETFSQIFDPTGNIFPDFQAIFNKQCTKNCDDPSKYYDPGYDNTDVDDVFNNDDAYRNVVGCLLDEAPCNSTTQDFKDIYAELIKTACCRCSPAFKCVAQKFIYRLLREHPIDYVNIRRKYDPSGKYWSGYETALKKVKCPQHCGDSKYFYSATFEDNITRILDDPKLYEARVGCFLDREPCSQHLREYKNIVFESVKQACCKCSPEIKCEGKEFFDGLALDHKQDLKAFEQKYDPTGEYFQSYLKVLQAADCTPECNDPKQYYDPATYGGTDSNALLENPPALRQYLKCFLNQAPCNAKTQKLKEIYKEAVMQACCKCSPTLKCRTRYFLDQLLATYPNLYKKLQLAYDPTGEYWDPYIKALNKVQCPENCYNPNYYYYKKYDNINRTAILTDPELYNSFVGCLLSRAPCSEYLQEFKEVIRTVVVEACCHCSPVFRCGAKEFYTGLQKDHPQDYEAWKLQYDPTGKYFADYLEILNETNCPTSK